MSEPLSLTINQLSFQRETRLIADLSFHLQSGNGLIITGVNGAGKSTLLRLLAGFITPMQGQISLNGTNIATIKTAYQAQLHFLAHSNGSKLGLTVAENLKLNANLHFHALEHYQQEIENLHLTHKLNVPIHLLSAGQRRRVALLKLFLIPKRIWILDEPLTTLDKDSQSYFLTKLDEHLVNHGMAIISSHQPLNLTTHSLSYLTLSNHHA